MQCCSYLKGLGGACSFSKVLSLLYLTLGLVWIGGLGIFAVTGESLYDAFWQVRHFCSRFMVPSTSSMHLLLYLSHTWPDSRRSTVLSDISSGSLHLM